jgi:hypothetical protein
MATYNANKKSWEANDHKWRRNLAFYKKGKKCATCGCKDEKYFHLDPTLKKSVIGGGHVNGKKIEEECQILCIWCHRLKSKSEIKKKTIDDYRWDSDKIINGPFKICNGEICNGKEIPQNLFYQKRKDNHTYLQAKCKNCFLYKVSLVRKKKKQYIIDSKHKIGKCVQCDLKVENGYECCFDYDHIDPKQKFKSVSKMTEASFELIKNEIEKCQLLCCFCHYDKTTIQLSYKSASYLMEKYDDSVRKDKERELKKNKKCEKCNKDIQCRSKLCVKCNGIARSIEIPSYQMLLDDYAILGSYVDMGKKYDVPDTSIKKWILYYADNKEDKKLLKKKCNKCNKDIQCRSKLCVNCSRIARRTVERPSHKTLLEDYVTLGSYVAMSKKYGVSDVTIKKWISYTNT